MNEFREDMTALEFGELFAECLSVSCWFVSVGAVSVAETGGGCTASVLTFTTDDGRNVSLVMMTTHSAVDGVSVANMRGEDGEFLVVGLYNDGELFEQTYDGSDPRDIHVSSVAGLLGYCGDYLAEWERVTRF